MGTEATGMRAVKFRTPGRSVAVTLVLATGLSGGQAVRPPSPAETDRATESLRQISRELTETLRHFDAHLGQTIERYDRGYRLETRGQVQEPMSI